MRWFTYPALVLSLACAPQASPLELGSQRLLSVESKRVLASTAQSQPSPHERTPASAAQEALSSGASAEQGAAAAQGAAAEQSAAAAQGAGTQPQATDSLPAFRQAVVPREETVVRVLLYHSIGSTASRPAVKVRAFRQQLNWMQDADVEIIHLSQLLDFLDGKISLPRHVAVITIDDGEANGYSVAYQVLRERRLPFTLGIATEAIQERHKRGTLSWDQIREMLESGLCEIASHSITHRAMTSLPDEVAQRELERSRAVLEDALGFQPQAFFYPLGDHDRRIRRLTKLSGYRAAFVAQGGPTVANTPRFRIPRYDVKPEALIWTFQRFFNHEIKMLGRANAPRASQVGSASWWRASEIENEVFSVSQKALLSRLALGHP